MNSIHLAFLAGLTTGGISCLFIQGGLLATSIGINKNASRFVPTIYFLAGKLLSHATLGLVLGIIGSQFIISPKVQGILQIVAGIMMIVTSFHLLGMLRWLKVSMTPPKILLRFVKNKTSTPFLLGASTVLIPCGVTQAMITLAIAQASPFASSGILIAFTLGTAPYFLAIGTLSQEILKIKYFAYIGAIVLLIAGASSVNSGQILRGSIHTWQNYKIAINELFGKSQVLSAATIDEQGYQNVKITVRQDGYATNTNTIKKGIPVKLVLTSEDVKGCAQTFNIPSLNISVSLPTNGEKIIEFIPKEPGRITYSCAIGVYNGYLDVI